MPMSYPDSSCLLHMELSRPGNWHIRHPSATEEIGVHVFRLWVFKENSNVVNGYLLLATQVARSQVCPDLNPAAHMQVSSSSAEAGDPPIAVTCDAGYKLDTHELVMYVECMVSGTWNDTLGNCTKKECPDISWFLSPDMSVLSLPLTSYYGDNVTVTCDTGYAFSVDHAQPVTTRVTPSQEVTCDDDPDSIDGKWSTIGTCSEIQCEEPPEVSNAFRYYNNVTYGSNVTYRCHSGYYTYNVFSVNAACNASATWQSNVGNWNNLEAGRTAACNAYRKNMACYNTSCFSASISSEASGGMVSDCQQFCRDNTARFLALSNGTCHCFDDVPTCQKELATECDEYCPNYDPVPENSPDPVYCGGTGTATVFYVYEGCLDGIDTDVISSEDVNGDMEATCRERCRARDFTHAGLKNVTCYCLNTTDLSGSYYSGCGTLTINVFDIARYNMQGRTCLELFDNGIRMAGTYYMSDPVRMEQCHFKDGTVCDYGWVGYDGYCYFTNAAAMADFNGSRQFCQQHGAELASILSQDEQDFLTDYKRNYKPEIWGDSTDDFWWLGMGDGTSSSMFMWLDGSMMRYSNFMLGTPAQLAHQCAVEDLNNWQDHGCTEKKNVMCKKLAGWSYCVSPSVPLTDPYVTEDAGMSLTFCIETCKGQEAALALVRNTTCTCTNVTVPGDFRNDTECSTPCPGQTFQFCGGSDTFTYINVSGRANAQSCEEQQLIGLGESNYLIESDNGTSFVEHCGEPTCPYSWLSVGPHCYKAYLTTQGPADAFHTCARDNAYAVTIETEAEIEDLLGAMNKIAIYSGQASWRVGLRALSRQGALFRWANGKQVNNSLWDNNGEVTNKEDVIVEARGNKTWSTATGKHVFICEKANDYLGCYSSVASQTTASITAYDKMTVTLCVERCRADGLQYAYLTVDSCYCWSSLTDPWQGDPCLTSCNGQEYQPCGGDDTHNQMSVYNVSEYPEFATKCEDLSEVGIFLSGTYIVNGRPTDCDLIDDTECDDNAEWFGYEDNCYRHFPANSAKTRTETCREHNATQASLFSQGEWDILTYFIRRTHFDNRQRIFTGITDGGYGLDIFIGQDGLLVEPGLIEAALILPEDLDDDMAYISFRINQHTSFTHDGGVICKKEKNVLGCFDKPVSITPVLQNYGSVELTQCRQLCAVSGHNVTLLGKDYCACASYTEAGTFAPPSGSCDDACSMHQDQHCGDGTVVWAHRTVWEEVRYAANCSDLYKAGILYDTFYIMENAVPGTLRYEKCGFTDDTACPPTFLGKYGECFKFNREPVDLTTAATNCFKSDSFLFNPTNNTLNEKVSYFIILSGLLDGELHWHAGVLPIYYNFSYVGPNGMFVETQFSNETNIPEQQTGYDIETNTWFGTEASEKLPYICQTNKAFLGCQTIATAADASYESAWNSMTMCIQWCYGQDMWYAATHKHQCACYVTLPTMTSAYGSCNISCEVMTSQPCGGISNGSMFHSVMELSDDTTLTTSCVALYEYGVVQPGRYYIQGNTNVNCFTEAGAYQEVKEANITSKSASSSKTGYSETYSSFNFPSLNVWKPSTDSSSEYLLFTLDEYYIITGILTTGLRSAAEFSFVKSFKLSYWEKLTGNMEVYVQNGTTELKPWCTEVGMCRAYFSKPFITKRLQVNPETWTNAIALQFLVNGQSASQFDYDDQYIGCHLDPYDTFIYTGVTGDLDTCMDHCKQESYPFISIDVSTECRCSSAGVEMGLVDDTDCPVNGAVRVGLSGRRAIYRTYEAVCLEQRLPELANGSISNVTFPYRNATYTYATEVIYTCDDGFEFIDGSSSEMSVCQHNNQWRSLAKECKIKSCQSFTVDGGAVTITSHQYQGVATVTCNAGLFAENGRSTIDVTCESNKEWSRVPTCTVHNEGISQGNFFVAMDKVRSQSAVSSESNCRSKLDCAGKCTSNFNCKGANYKPTSAKSEIGTCRLFETAATNGELLHETGWEYMEL